MFKEYDIELFINEDKCLDYDDWGSMVFVTLKNSKGYYFFNVVGNKIEYEDDILIEWSNHYQLVTYISDDNGRNFKTILKCYGNYRLLGWEYNANKLHIDIRKEVR